MIAIVIGLFISLMVVQYLSTSTRLFKQQGADTNLEANGTFAISYMTQFIRQAGSNNPLGTDVPFYTGECGDADPCTFNEDNPDESDQIAVQMVPHNGQDCVGNPVPDGDRIANVFSVKDSSLVCQGYNVERQLWLGPEESLIDGVEQLQVLYGISNEDGVVERYVDASRVADGMAAGHDLEVAWDRIRSTKIAVLVSDVATKGTETIAEPRTYQLLDSPEVTRDDRISRRVYSTTVNINNKLP